MIPPVSVVVVEGEHLATIPGSAWRAWRWALIRSAGFPAAGVDRFAAPECAHAADRLLATGTPDSEAELSFSAAFDAAVRDTAKAVHDVAADPRFRMAITW